MSERKLPWTPIEVEPSRSELEIAFETTAYDSDLRVDVRETARTVRISIHASWNPPVGNWFSYTTLERRTVQFAKSLGTRKLVGRSVHGRRGPRLDTPRRAPND